MTLEELLALLPDNDTGAIDAADLRVIVTELHTLGSNALNTAQQAAGVADNAYGQIAAVTDMAAAAQSDADDAQADAATAQTAAAAAQSAATTASADAAAAQSAAASATSQVSALTPRVTALEAEPELIGQMFTYEWSTAATPAVGKITSNPQWSASATVLKMSETTADGASIFFTLVDAALGTEIVLRTQAGGKLVAHTLGPSVDQGTYRDIPITVNSAVGAVPASNDRVTVTVLLVVG